MDYQPSLGALWNEHQKNLRTEGRKTNALLGRLFHKWRIPEKLFDIFEKNLKKLDPDHSMGKFEKQLTHNSLKQLIHDNSICAIHVRGFCPSDTANSLSKIAIEEYTHWKLGGIQSTDMFYAGGSIPGEVANHSWHDFQRYFSERDQFVQRQREMSNQDWPVDHLRLALDDAWPYGACVGNFMGHKLRPAIMRIMDAKAELDISVPSHGLIHADDFVKIKPSSGTYTANIYLKVPDKGGELYIWPINLYQVGGFYKNLTLQLLSLIINQDYIFTDKWQKRIFNILPQPFVIKPKQGDLIIFHSGIPHSVAPVKKGTRVTNQLFINVKEAKTLNIRS